MAYRNFTLDALRKVFGLQHKVVSIFPEMKAVQPSPWLQKSLDMGFNLPINSEKARSEFIVAPILAELRERNRQFFTIYSGENLNVDQENGLNGECDFMLGIEESSLVITAPVFSVVEAKRGEISLGIGQCAAQMLGAKYWNESEGKAVSAIYGCVTTADEWKFMKLEGDMLWIEKRTLYINEIELILGVFQETIDLIRLEWE